MPFGLKESTGYIGLLKDRQAVRALTSGAYSPTAPSPIYGVDHYSTCLRCWLNLARVTDVEETRFAPTFLPLAREFG